MLSSSSFGMPGSDLWAEFEPLGLGNGDLYHPTNRLIPGTRGTKRINPKMMALDIYETENELKVLCEVDL
jgi:hypothetical protein